MRDFYFVRFMLRPLSLRFACFLSPRALRFLRFLRFALRSLSLRMLFAGRVVKEKGEPRGENDHGSFPLVLSGQRRAAGALTIRASRAVC